MAYSEISKATTVDDADIGLGNVADYVALLKPRVMSLVVFTAFVGMAIAPGGVNPVIGAAALLAIAVGAGAAGALNMWYDADIDRLMRRTAPRPIPAGRLAPGDALGFGLTLAVGSVAFLGLATSYLAAALLAFTIFFYVVIYTMWLKRLTPLNIVIGGAAGALPPVIGWAVVTGSIAWPAVVLFAIVFLWTPPHFWALSLYRSEDYARAGVPMLPVVAGVPRTKRDIVIYSVILTVFAAVVPPAIGMATIVYGVIAGALGILFVWLAVQVARMPAGDKDMRAARHLFAYSMLYLFLLFAILLVESGIGWMHAAAA
jgi:protoheme IX farnesyltransferase